MFARGLVGSRTLYKCPKIVVDWIKMAPVLSDRRSHCIVRVLLCCAILTLVHAIHTIHVIHELQLMI